MSDVRIADFTDLAVVLSRQTSLTKAQAMQLGYEAFALGLQPMEAYDLIAVALSAGLNPRDAMQATTWRQPQIGPPVVGPRHNRLVTELGIWWFDVAGWWVRAYRAATCFLLQRFAAPVPRETVGRHRK